MLSTMTESFTITGISTKTFNSLISILLVIRYSIYNDIITKGDRLRTSFLVQCFGFISILQPSGHDINRAMIMLSSQPEKMAVLIFCPSVIISGGSLLSYLAESVGADGDRERQ